MSTAFHVCRTPMEEIHRESLGDRWCFHCRRRHEFVYLIRATVEPSYYDPTPSIQGLPCGAQDGDMFPGHEREWGEG